MTAAEEFFRELGERGHEPLLGGVTGVVRFDVVDGERTRRWAIRIVNGRLAVSENGEAPDCTIRIERALFERLVEGRENVMALVLRGGADCAGDVELLLSVQRLFPGPPNQIRRGRDAVISR